MLLNLEVLPGVSDLDGCYLGLLDKVMGSVWGGGDR